MAEKFRQREEYPEVDKTEWFETEQTKIKY